MMYELRRLPNRAILFKCLWYLIGRSSMTSSPIDCKCSQASNSEVFWAPLRSAMVQEQVIRVPRWTGMEIFQGLFFHRSLTARIISIASLAATFLRRAESHVSLGISTISLRSWDFDGVQLFQKWFIKMLQTRPYSARTLWSSCLLEAVANFKEHLLERMIFIKDKRNRGRAGRLLQKLHSLEDATFDSRLFSWFIRSREKVRIQTSRPV